MVGVLFPGQLQQVFEGELAVDLSLVIPPPPRYHVGITPARAIRPGWLGVADRSAVGGVRCGLLGAS
jgi:hypothetical protein